tara:strand:+ start:382 stop:1092 length:711 start_codon:yes stop_codon:yes gene_type:complete
MKNNGFVYVASVNKQFYYAALYSAQSLLDFYPEAKITLFTHETWVCDEAREIFDQIITEGVPNHIRAKLWALSKSPYDTTLYIDCDTTIQSEEISEVFDLLGDNDIIFTRNRPYNAKITKLSETEEMIYHCGLFLYNTKTTKDLMDSWYTGYLEQNDPRWDPSPYPEEVRKWDTFTMWNLLTNGNFQVKVGEFPAPDAKWNFVNGYKEEELMGEEIVIQHYTIAHTRLMASEVYRP